MKSYFNRHAISFAMIIAFTVFIITSYTFGYTPGIEIFEKNFVMFSGEMTMFLPLMFIIIGLFDIWAPRDLIERHIGSGSGVKGAIWMILLSMLQAGPLYGAFPVACMLYKKGASLRNIFIYLGAFSTLKIPMLTFEIGFLGLKFTILRTILTVPIFILIAVLMEQCLKQKNFARNE